MGERATTEQQAQFARQGYLVVPQFLEPGVAALLWQYVSMQAAYGLLAGGGQLVPGSVGGYADPAFEALLASMRTKVEALTGIALHPTYSFFRVYRRGNELRRHHDRPACEISVSVNLGQNPAAPWPLHIAGKTGDGTALLGPADALIYRGIDLDHWREPYEGTQLGQVFLHYVNRNGPHAAQKYDGRAGLMQPRKGPEPDAV